MEGIDLFLGRGLPSVIRYELRPGTSTLSSKNSFSTGLAAKVDFHVPGGVVTKIGIEKEDKSSNPTASSRNFAGKASCSCVGAENDQELSVILLLTSSITPSYNFRHPHGSQ